MNLTSNVESSLALCPHSRFFRSLQQPQLSVKLLVIVAISILSIAFVAPLSANSLCYLFYYPD
jgi:hypothetical protein